jgi:hypothetical protein
MHSDAKKRRSFLALLFGAGDLRCSPALRSGERGRGSGIRLSARRRANKRMEQTLRVVK